MKVVIFITMMSLVLHKSKRNLRISTRKITLYLQILERLNKSRTEWTCVLKLSAKLQRRRRFKIKAKEQMKLLMY